MKGIPFFAVSIPMLAACGCSAMGGYSEVRVTLNDGQVLVGTIATEVFRLKTGLGTFDFDSRHAGELGPLEGPDVEKSGRAVKLWLKNGSEFVGHWEKASVAVLLEAGGSAVNIDVPIAKLKRLQFRGNDEWSDEPVFRVITAAGDDFFAACTKTRITFRNDFCEISPFLSEIRQLYPQDEKKKTWRIELENGTALNAEIPQSEILFHLDMGPQTISVPMASIEFMDRQAMYRQASSGIFHERSASKAMPQQDYDAPGYYSNAAQKAAKESAGAQWKNK